MKLINNLPKSNNRKDEQNVPELIEIKGNDNNIRKDQGREKSSQSYPVKSETSWDILFYANTLEGGSDLLYLGRKLKEKGHSVAICDINNFNLKRMAKFEGVEMVNTGKVKKVKLLVSSFPHKIDVEANYHLCISLEPWLDIDFVSKYKPDETIVRNSWEANILYNDLKDLM